MQRLFISALLFFVSSVFLSQESIDTINYSIYPAMVQYEINAINDNFTKADNPLIVSTV